MQALITNSTSFKAIEVFSMPRFAYKDHPKDVETFVDLLDVESVSMITGYGSVLPSKSKT